MSFADLRRPAERSLGEGGIVTSGARTVAVTPCFDEEEPISVLAASAVVNGRFQVRAADDRNPRQSFYWEVKAVRADVEPLDAEQPKGEGKHAGALQAKRGARMPELSNVP